MSSGLTTSLFKNGNTEIYPGQAAEAFNKYFLTLIEGENRKNIYADSAISFLRNSYPNGFPNAVTFQITEVELVRIINSLKTKTSSGYDDISK